MKKSILLVCLLSLALPGFTQGKKVEISPKKSIAKVVLSGKSDYTYYALSENSKTEYQVTGPGQLHLNFRVRMDGEAFKSQPLKVKYVRSDNYVKSVDVPELLVSNLKFKSSSLEGHPSKSYQLVVNVPPGKHTYRFYKQATEQNAHMRAFYEAHPKPDWQDIKPTLMLDKKDVRFVKSGKTKSYYEITKQSGYDFSVSDTSRIRVIVRPEFSYKMLEETILKVKLQNLTTGQSKIYKITAHKSNKVEFVSDEKLTPGTSKIFYLNLPKPASGNDAYSISILSGAKAAVIRLSNDKNLIR